MHCRRQSDLAGDGGAVTVEAALALGSLVLVTSAAVAAVAAVAAGVRCTDAARELALQAARGDADRGRVAATALAPAGAESDLRIDGDSVVATVRARPVELLPISVTGSAVAVVEPGLSASATGPDPPVTDAPAPRGEGPDEHPPPA
ncbi:TadE family type IV pilus minor pilin [Pseudonocardia parietis]|uniref:TadE-like protein n=1 Tax=Pseudonocardia parietis TaxID=570936 RepID=A0ABS4VLB6_9PSEU|nr:TadE family type IV pilus minor pilin [Pseudonocardia parietis]MBP2364404.1 hypothetical protein [Pseudonocardia parietis]